VCQELRIVDEPVGNQPPRPLIVLGKAQSNAESPAYGVFYVKGTVEVDGPIEANQFVPSGGRTPAISLEDFFRALQSGRVRVSPVPRQGKTQPNPPSPTQPPPEKTDDSDAGSATTKTSDADAAPK
jgi:hypothetical protein